MFFYIGVARGKLIAIEGIDKAGKHTQQDFVSEWLVDMGHMVKVMSEPNDNSPIGCHIRRILKSEVPAPELFEMQRLFVLDRALDLVLHIHPYLGKPNNYVLIERFALSTLAYGMTEHSADDLIDLHYSVIGSFMLWPDITYLLDISAEEAMRRLKIQQGIPQFFEKMYTLRKVHKNYLTLAERNDVGEVVVVNGMQSKENVFADIKQDLQARL